MVNLDKNGGTTYHSHEIDQ